VQITCFLHTETQDGKTALDAHFARAGDHVRRFLLSFKRNHVKKVASPKALAAALASNGGLQNCVVQLLSVDDCTGELISDFIKKAADKGNEYFSRANDMEFLPPVASAKSLFGNVRDKASFKYTTFQVKVWAYSNIGSGVTFDIKLCPATYTPCSADGPDTDGRHQLEAIQQLQSISAADQELHDMSSNVNSLDESEDPVDEKNDEHFVQTEPTEGELDDSDSDDDIDDEEHAKALCRYADSGSTYIKSEDVLGEDSVTGVVVKMHSSLGEVLGPRTRGRNPRNQPAQRDEGYSKRDMITTAIQNVLLMVSGGENEYGIRDGYAVMPEYGLSKGIDLSKFKNGFPRGWARGPPRCEQYGCSFIGPYREDIRAFFERGVREPSKNMNASVMLEELT